MSDVSALAARAKATMSADQRVSFAPRGSRFITWLVGLQDIADAADRLKELHVEWIVDLAAQALDVDVHDIGPDIEMIFPHALDDLGAAEHATGTAHKQFEEFVFAG